MIGQQENGISSEERISTGQHNITDEKMSGRSPRIGRRGAAGKDWKKKELWRLKMAWKGAWSAGEAMDVEYQGRTANGNNNGMVKTQGGHRTRRVWGYSDQQQGYCNGVPVIVVSG